MDYFYHVLLYFLKLKKVDYQQMDQNVKKKKKKSYQAKIVQIINERLRKWWPIVFFG